MKLRILIPESLEGPAAQVLDIFNSFEDDISCLGYMKGKTLILALEDFSVYWFELEKLLKENKQVLLSEFKKSVVEALRRLTDKQLENNPVSFRFAQQIMDKY